MGYFFLLVSYGFEPVIWLLIFKNVFESRYRSKKPYLLCFLGSYALICLKQFIVFRGIIPELEVILMVALALYYLICFRYLFQGKQTKQLICLCSMYLCAIVTELIALSAVTMLFGWSLNEVSCYGVKNIMAVYISKIMLAVICYNIYIGKCGRKILRGIMDNIEITPILVGVILFEIPAMFIFNNMRVIGYDSDVFLFFGFGEISFVFVSIYLVIFVRRFRKREREFNERINEVKSEIKVNDMSEEIRQLRHDLKNHIMVMQQMQSDGQYDEVEKYLNNLNEKVISTDNYFSLENKQVAALLNQKKHQAAMKKIEFNASVMVQNFKLNDLDMCSLMGNILANAIEVAELVELEANRYIDLEIKGDQEGYTIECSNGYQKEPVFQKGEYLSTKDNPEKHGFGLEIIRKVAHKYNGNVRIDFSRKASTFTVVVYIPYY